MLKINKLQKQIKYYTTMTETKTIALSKETAELFDCKKNLDECFNTLGNVHETIFGYEEGFENSLGKAYVAMNDIIIHLLSEQIDNNSTESQYKVI